VRLKALTSDGGLSFVGKASELETHLINRFDRGGNRARDGQQIADER
jgi:hypothetical protein